MSPQPVQALLLLSFVASLLQVVGILRAQHRQHLLALFHQLATAQQERSLAYNGIHQFKRGGRGRPTRRFWTRPGTSEEWLSAFVNNIVLPEEWYENFRMTKKSFTKPCELLRPFLQRQDTNMRKALNVEKQVPINLYYL